MKTTPLPSRRQALKSSAALLGLTTVSPGWVAALNHRQAPYPIGVCDWSIDQLGEVEALAFAEKIGLDGVQVSLGTLANDMHLRQPEVQQAYREAAQKHNVRIPSLAIGELNQVPYKSEPQTEAWVRDSIDVAQAMGCPIVLLAFFSKGDLKGDEAGQQEVIRRLRKVAPRAEEAGVTLGIESWLSADEHLAIIEAVGSSNVRVYYDVANSHKMGYDIYEEMARLGSEYICEVHMKENGRLLGQGGINFTRVGQILDDMNYQGWVIIEGAWPGGMDLLETYKANNQYLRKVINRG
jgi:sugar phosphate isomerase/epimerase